MIQKQLYEVISKAIGLFFLVQMLQALRLAFVNAYGLGLYSQDNQIFKSYVVVPIMDLAFYVLAAWIFIAKAELISLKLAGKRNDQLVVPLGKPDFIELVVLAIGTLAVVGAIPELLHKVSQYLYFNTYGRADNQFWDDKGNRAAVVYSMLKLAVGLVTVANARVLARRLSGKDQKSGDKHIG